MPKINPTSPKALPPVDYLRACFDYDPKTGILTWKGRPREHFPSNRTYSMWNTRYAGKPAGWKNSGYLIVHLGRPQYKVHRVIWKLMTGEEPPTEIDHKDRDPYDNRWDQLRPATRSEQTRNRGQNRNNTTGFRGVYREPNGKWRAQIGKRYLGLFVTPEEAAAAYEAAARELHGEFFSR